MFFVGCDIIYVYLSIVYNFRNTIASTHNVITASASPKVSLELPNMHTSATELIVYISNLSKDVQA